MRSVTRSIIALSMSFGINIVLLSDIGGAEDPGSAGMESSRWGSWGSTPNRWNGRNAQTPAVPGAANVRSGGFSSELIASRGTSGARSSARRSTRSNRRTAPNRATTSRSGRMRQSEPVPKWFAEREERREQQADDTSDVVEYFTMSAEEFAKSRNSARLNSAAREAAREIPNDDRQTFDVMGEQVGDDGPLLFRRLYRHQSGPEFHPAPRGAVKHFGGAPRGRIANTEYVGSICVDSTGKWIPGECVVPDLKALSIERVEAVLQDQSEIRRQREQQGALIEEIRSKSYLKQDAGE